MKTELKASRSDQETHAGDIAARQRWISLLSRATQVELENAWLEQDTSYDVLRGPEVGLVMVRGRAGGTGQKFNMGEATVTRCTVRLMSGEVGHGWVQGREKRRAELAALFDACLQNTDLGADIDKKLLKRVEERLAVKRQKRRDKVEATKVDFFTLVRGED